MMQIQIPVPVASVLPGLGGCTKGLFMFDIEREDDRINGLVAAAAKAIVKAGVCDVTETECSGVYEGDIAQLDASLDVVRLEGHFDFELLEAIVTWRRYPKDVSEAAARLQEKAESSPLNAGALQSVENRISWSQP